MIEYHDQMPTYQSAFVSYLIASRSKQIMFCVNTWHDLLYLVHERFVVNIIYTFANVMTYLQIHFFIW